MSKLEPTDPELKEAQKEIAIINADIKNLKALLDVYKKDLALVEEALAKCVATEGAFTCMERNFNKWNGFMPLPTRSCLKIGEPVSKYPMIINTIRIGLSRTKPMNENRMSKIRVTSY